MSETRKTWNDYLRLRSEGLSVAWARYYARNNRARRDPKGKLAIMNAQRMVEL